MNRVGIIRCAVLLIATLSWVGVYAQTARVQLHVDNNGSTRGCEINVANAGATLEGIDVLITATIDRPSMMITSVSAAECIGAAFGAAEQIGSGIPLGLDNGVNGADVVEIAIPLNRI